MYKQHCAISFYSIPQITCMPILQYACFTEADLPCPYKSAPASILGCAHWGLTWLVAMTLFLLNRTTTFIHCIWIDIGLFCKVRQHKATCMRSIILVQSKLDSNIGHDIGTMERFVNTGGKAHNHFPLNLHV